MGRAYIRHLRQKLGPDDDRKKTVGLKRMLYTFEGIGFTGSHSCTRLVFTPRNFMREINETLIVRNQYCDARNDRH